jgi:hypothetical protein
VTCMSWIFGTPSEDCESLAPWKKSDSSLSGGTGELADEVERESWGSRRRGASLSSRSLRAPGAVSEPAIMSMEAACLMVSGVCGDSSAAQHADCCDCCGEGVSEGSDQQRRLMWDVEWAVGATGGRQM